MKNSTFLVSLVFLLSLVGCQQGLVENNKQESYTQVVKELDQLWANYFDASLKGDMATVLSFMTEDYKNLISTDVTQDFQDTEEMVKNIMENYTWSRIDYERSELFVHDTMAYDIGFLDQTMISRDNQDTISARNRCLTVFKKMDDGTWKLYRWMPQ
jgi:ketosteroid isomerase-like protein